VAQNLKYECDVKCKLTWAGNVFRMEESDPAKKDLYQTRWKRRQERQNIELKEVTWVQKLENYCVVKTDVAEVH